MSHRYYSLNQFFREKFGEKVYRVSVDAGFTCPNRDGTLGRGGCIYCNEAGARASYVNPDVPVAEQIRQGQEIIRRRYNARKFLVYFQAYTNTYAPVERLREIYAPVLLFPDVVGIAVGTRPDCADEAKLDLLAELGQKTYVLVEYGVQSLKEESLRLIRRGHDVEATLRAIQMTKERRDVDILAHLIFGIPGESRDDMIQNVRTLVDRGVNAFKFHHLYVEQGTELEKRYRQGEFQPLGLQEYIELLGEILPLIPPQVVIHRLFGQCAPDKLVAPDWTADKANALRLLEEYLEEKDIRQGSATL